MRYPFHDWMHFFGQKPVGHYELNHFPGCNQIVISNHSCIYPKYRGKGLGTQLAREKIQVATDEGFDYMIATVVSTNTAQLKIMEKNGWKLLDTFFNRESGNEVNIFGRRLSE
jgi:RimJ/RimL family protein N-acetyltransferase